MDKNNKDLKSKYPDLYEKYKSRADQDFNSEKKERLVKEKKKSSNSPVDFFKKLVGAEEEIPKENYFNKDSGEKEASSDTGFKNSGIEDNKISGSDYLSYLREKNRKKTENEYIKKEDVYDLGSDDFQTEKSAEVTPKYQEENTFNLLKFKNENNTIKDNNIDKAEDDKLDNPLDLRDKYGGRKKSGFTLKKFGIIALSFIILLAVLIYTLPIFRINSYTIENQKNTNRNAIELAANKLLGTHVFFYKAGTLDYLKEKDPYLKNLTLYSKLDGKVKIEVEEYKKDYLLISGKMGYFLDRNGRILETTKYTDGVTIILRDNTKPMTPGNEMYQDSEKKNFLVNFKNLLDSNTSGKTFSEVNIINMKDIKLKSGKFTILLGTEERLKEKLNNAVNILKTMDPEAAGEIDLRFDTNPVIRRK